MCRVPLAVAVLALAWAGCFSRPIGFYRCDRPVPRPDAYDERFAPLVLRADTPCESVRAEAAPDAPIVILVPGVGGDGEEMRDSVPLVMKSKPAAALMFRYQPFHPTEALLTELSAGLSRVFACNAPERRYLILSHSAGGVLSSLALERVTRPEGAADGWLTLLTVASPLAGVAQVPGNARPDDRPPFMRMLGQNITSYPSPVSGARVVHLRSSAKSDGFMRPNGDHLPNDRAVGVPNAPQIDLPEELDHSAALVYVAKHVADGSYQKWLGPLPQAIVPGAP